MFICIVLVLLEPRLLPMLPTVRVNTCPDPRTRHNFVPVLIVPVPAHYPYPAGTGNERVRVRVQLNLPPGYPCYCLKEPEEGKGSELTSDGETEVEKETKD